MNSKAIITAVILAAIFIGGGLWLFQDPSVPVTPQKNDEKLNLDSPEAKKDEKSEVDPDPEISKTGPYPKAVAEEDEFDFGVMGTREEKSHEFVIKNEGEAPLVLAKGKTTCKCTLSNLNQNSIPPGESAKVILTWNPDKPTKVFRHTARIKTNDPENQVIKLVVSGSVESAIMTDPAGHWNLGYVLEDEPGKFSGKLFSKTADKMEVLEHKIIDENITAEFLPLSEDELTQLEAKTGYTVNFEVSPNIKVGGIKESLMMILSLDGQKLATRIPLTGGRIGPIRIIKAVSGRVKWIAEDLLLNMGTFPAKEGLKITMPMYIIGMKDDFKIEEIQSDLDFVKLTITKVENQAPEEDLEIDETLTSEPQKSLDVKNIIKEITEKEPEDNSDEKQESDQTEGKNSEKKPATKNQRFNITFEVEPGNLPTSRVFEEAVKIRVKTNHPKMKELVFQIGFVSI